MKFIPSPPDLKPTIIQMQNIESNQSQTDDSIDPKFTPKENSSQQQQINQPKRKRRRSSSSLISQNELEKRKKEHKTAHSIIEKKRRIRMNREFEALKYLIPACRNNLGQNGGGGGGNGNGNGNGNNGEGMYKLTILQATVDYIKYLHQVINIQQDELQQQQQQQQVNQFDDDDNDQDQDEDQDEAFNNLDFAKIDVDTDSYRNLDIDFDFNKLFAGLNKEGSSSGSISGSNTSSRQQPNKIKGNNLSINKSKSTSQTTTTDKFQPLPSPLITSELFPNSATSTDSTNLTPLGNYKTINPEFQFKITTESNNSANATICKGQFQLPKPAISKHFPSSSLDSNLTIINELALRGPKDPSHCNDTSKRHLNYNLGFDHDDNSASNVLMSMKRDSTIPSIRSLLN